MNFPNESLREIQQQEVARLTNDIVAVLRKGVNGNTRSLFLRPDATRTIVSKGIIQDNTLATIEPVFDCDGACYVGIQVEDARVAPHIRRAFMEQRYTGLQITMYDRDCMLI